MSEWTYGGSDITWALNFKQPSIEESIAIDKDFWGEPENHVQRSLVFLGPGDLRKLKTHEAIIEDDDLTGIDIEEFFQILDQIENQFTGLAQEAAVAGCIFLALIDEEGNLYLNERAPGGIFFKWQSDLTGDDLAFDPDISCVELRAIIALWARHRGIIDADDLTREMKATLTETEQVYRFFKSFRPDTINKWGSIEIW